MTGAPPAAARLRVVTWNIRAGIGPGEPFPPAWWRHVRRDRLERIASLLRSLDPDVALLQEVAVMTPHGELSDQPAILAGLTERHARYAAVHAYPLADPETGRAIGFASWGNAILTRRPLQDGFALGLPQAGDDDLVEPAGSTDALAGVRYADADPGPREPRCLVGGRVPGALESEAGVTVATAHLTYVGAAQRGAQADAIVAELATRHGPMALAGDFNAPLAAPELAGLWSAFDDAFAAVGVADNGPARATFGPKSIDHVLVRDLRVESCRVVVEAGDASDHWPVVADLRPA